MEELILNETPVRTSNNFKINNISIENITLPTKKEAFNNIEIKQNGFKCENMTNNHFVYGTGKVLEDNINNFANHCLKMQGKGNLTITYNFDDNNTTLINNLEIIADGDSNILIIYKSKTDKKCFHNGKIKFTSNENAKIDIAIVNLLNNNSNYFEAMENDLGANSTVNYTIIDIGGKNSITNYYSNAKGDKSVNELKTVYLGIENQLKDINYIAHLNGEKTMVNIDVQGALNDTAKKNFKGTLDFKKGCKKSKGDENEFCMLLSDKAKSIALPMLLCTEDDVEGNHSTASGKVDANDLFYIMSRGIEYKEAIKLIVRARFHKIIESIKDEDVKQEILQEIDRRLDK